MSSRLLAVVLWLAILVLVFQLCKSICQAYGRLYLNYTMQLESHTLILLLINIFFLLLGSARDMITSRCLNDQHLPEGCALEVLGSDDFDTKDDIIDETIKFLVGCLNSRAEGVSCGLLVAGADYQPHSPHQVKLGLSISRNDLRGLQMRFYELLRRRIFVQTVDNRIEPAHSLESLTRLEVLPVETQVDNVMRTPEVVVVSVVPEMPLCKDLLYLYNSSDSRRRHVYKRTDDGQVKINSQKRNHLHQKLIQHYNRWHQ